MQSSKLRFFIVFILSVYVVGVGTLFVLDYFKILPFKTVLSYIIPSGPKNLGIVTKNSSHSLTVSTLTPVPSGNFFNQLVRIPGQKYSMITVTGHITDIEQINGSTYLSMIKSDGAIIRDVDPLITNAGIIIATDKNGIYTEHTGTISDLKKGELVMVSYNVNPQTKRSVITGVRVMQ